jgi:predicted nucleic acid-binding protein
VTLVVDASIALGWLFDVPHSPAAQTLLQRQERLIAPDLIAAEIANAAWKFVQFDGLDAHFAADAVRQVRRLIDELVPCANLQDRAFAIAVELPHPAYDCFYLALAEQRDCRLATVDQRLVRACARTKYAALILGL